MQFKKGEEQEDFSSLMIPIQKLEEIPWEIDWYGTFHEKSQFFLLASSPRMANSRKVLQPVSSL